MNGYATFLLVATSLYAGFQWTIRLVVYPQFAAVPGAAFVAYERRHQQLLTWAVGPLFVAEAVAVALAFLHGPRLAAACAGAGLLVVLGLTAFGAVPVHRTLSDGFTPASHRRLLTVDTARLVAAGATVAAAVCYA